MVVGIAIASAVFAAACYVLYTTRVPTPKGLPAKVLTRAVDGEEHHRESVMEDGWVPVVTTLYEAFKRGYVMGPSEPFLGFRQMELPGKPYKWLSYEQIYERFRNVGSGLVDKGCQEQSFVGIYAKNSPNWGVVMHACSAYNMTLVPLYDTLGAKAMTHILDTTGLEVVFVDSALVYNILKWAEGSKIKFIVSIGSDLSDENIEKATSLGVEIMNLGDFEVYGLTKRSEPRPPTPEDIALICYTSGTTGTPKGALISHGNIAACCMGLKANVTTFLDHRDTIISYLPLAHVYQFAVECFFAYLGAKIGYFQGDLKLLLNDFETLSPTVIPSVPRVLNKAFDKINGLVHEKALVGKLFDIALASKMKEVEAGIYRRNSLWDRILFKKVQKSFGGKCRLLITGSAPCRGDILQWYRAVLGCYVMEGFGQTEMSGVSTMSLDGDHSIGHIGVPFPSLRVKLVDVPEKEYFAKDNRGEICFQGPTVFKGYYKDPEKTAAAIDSEGWLHSGDIGKWTDHGCLSIIDRKKNLFKLAQGEYIAPDKIEAVYERCPIVGQCFVYGESLKSSLVGIIVPDELILSKMDPPVSVEDFVADPNSAGMVLQTIQTMGQKELKSFEQVRHIKLVPEAFTVENNLVTPTMKKRREAIAASYSDVLQSMMVNMV